MEWRDVVGYEAYFSVSDEGHVYSKRSHKLITLTVSRTGYYTFVTRFNGRSGKCKCFKVHRLVADAFIDNPEDKPMVNHKDGNKLNNHRSNLEWNTASENIRHAYDTGLSKGLSGDDNKNSKISSKIAKEIREKYSKGNFTQRFLASQYKVGKTTIQNILDGSRW